MEGVPCLRLHLLQFKADRANRAKGQISIATIVGAEARGGESDESGLFAVAPVQARRTTGGAMLPPRPIKMVDPHPRGSHRVQCGEAGEEAEGVKGIIHGRQGTISTWVHKTQPTLSLNS